MTNGSALQLDVPTHHFARFRAAEWAAMLDHANCLAGAEYVGLFGEEGDGRTWIEFDLRLYHFTVEQDGRSHVTVTVDSRDCDPALLNYVQSHFASLLAGEVAA